MSLSVEAPLSRPAVMHDYIGAQEGRCGCAQSEGETKNLLLAERTANHCYHTYISDPRLPVSSGDSLPVPAAACILRSCPCVASSPWEHVPPRLSHPPAASAPPKRGPQGMLFARDWGVRDGAAACSCLLLQPLQLAALGTSAHTVGKLHAAENPLQRTKHRRLGMECSASNPSPCLCTAFPLFSSVQRICTCM